jgi:5-methylcytosine-specific restriction protein A
MPTQPPRFRPRGWKAPAPWATSAGKTRQQRGYGSEHDALRKQVLIEEPYCAECIRLGIAPPARTSVADHIVPQAEGGQTVRSNYQGLCTPHSRAKTAKESARARRRSRTP